MIRYELVKLAEGQGFEPWSPVSQANALAVRFIRRSDTPPNTLKIKELPYYPYQSQHRLWRDPMTLKKRLASAERSTNTLSLRAMRG